MTDEQLNSIASIAPGGCYRPGPDHDPLPRPPVPDTEPDPTSLYESYDWQACSHVELHKMVNDGIDITRTTGVAALWGELGQELQEIGADLRRISEATAQAWEGAAADRARNAVLHLSNWPAETSDLANKTCACVAQQANNAASARAEVPAPLPVPMTTPGTPAGAEVFTSGGFGSASMITTDPGPVASEAHTAHVQAADALQRFQERSREVYATVPQFAPPQPIGPDDGTAPRPQPGPTQSGQGAAGAALVGGPGTAGQPVAPRPGAGTQVTPNPSGPGPRAGGGAAPGLARPGAGAAGGMLGGGPMGAGSSRGEGDTEHKAAPYLKEDADIWGLPAAVAPPVIGE